MVDAVVTDPPYHLNTIVERFGKDGSAHLTQFGTDGAFKRTSTGFMGKEWDGGDIAFDPMTWSLCLGLLKQVVISSLFLHQETIIEWQLQLKMLVLRL